MTAFAVQKDNSNYVAPVHRECCSENQSYRVNGSQKSQTQMYLKNVLLTQYNTLSGCLQETIVLLFDKLP